MCRYGRVGDVLVPEQIQLIWAPTGQRKARRCWTTIWQMQPAVGPLPLLDKAVAKHSQSRHRRMRHNEQHIRESVRRPTVDARLSRVPRVPGPGVLSILRILLVLRSPFEGSTRLRFVEGHRTVIASRATNSSVREKQQYGRALTPAELANMCRYGRARAAAP